MAIAIPTCFVFGGAGTAGPCEVGALEVLVDDGARVAAAGGSSWGALMSLALSLGMSVKDLRALCVQVLTRKDLLDLSLAPWVRLGIWKGEVLYRVLKDIFGDKKMSDAKIPCRIPLGDKDGRCVITVSDETHPDALMRDVGRCAIAIPVWFKSWRLYANNASEYVDSGTGANFPIGIFDDLEPSTIGIRIAQSSERHRVRSLSDEVAALFGIRQYAANGAMASCLERTRVLDIDTKADGFDFSLSNSDVSALMEDGRRAAQRWLRGGT